MTSNSKKLFLSLLHLAFVHPEDHSTRLLDRAARGLVACFEANDGVLLHSSYDESGTCGAQFVPEESIWTRQSNNPTIKTVINDTVLTPEGSLWVDGLVKFVASSGRSCQFAIVIDASDEDALVRVNLPVLCRP